MKTLYFRLVQVCHWDNNKITVETNDLNFLYGMYSVLLGQQYGDEKYTCHYEIEEYEAHEEEEDLI